MTSRQLGLFWCATFVVLDAAQAVVFGGLLQSFDAFLIGGLVFGLSALGCGAAVLLRSPSQFTLARNNPSSVLWLNVHTAGGWLAYLAAVQMIEPAVAFTLFSGTIPFVLALSMFRSNDTKIAVLEAAGYAVLCIGMVWLSAVTLTGNSGFVREGLASGALGLFLSILSGAMMAGMLLASYRLSAHGIGPVALYSLRFPLYVVCAVLGYLAGFDDKGVPVSLDGLLIAVCAGFLLLAFPAYAVQKAVAYASTAAVGAATASIPAVVFVLQIVEGRVAFSGGTLAGLAIYSIGAALLALSAVRSRARVTDVAA